ncbi:MAG TPA: hypothetical protein VKX29_01505 [Brumimicrobium sp.]|nr:hypothetical protein [Brumimicrobium sp.]
MKRKLIYNRWKVSSEEIKKQQDFSFILKKANIDSSWKWKSIGFWGTAGTTAVALFFIVILF